MGLGYVIGLIKPIPEHLHRTPITSSVRPRASRGESEVSPDSVKIYSDPADVTELTHCLNLYHPLTYLVLLTVRRGMPRRQTAAIPCLFGRSWVRPSLGPERLTAIRPWPWMCVCGVFFDVVLSSWLSVIDQLDT